MPALPLVPAPVRATALDATPFELAGATVTGDPDAAAELARLLTARTGTAPQPAAGPDAGIRLVLSPGGTPESYTLRADAAGVRVEGADAAGVFFGVQTLAQLVRRDIDSGGGAWVVPAVEVDDAPRFRYRGMMLDVARHFHPVETVTAVIDRMALLKLTHLHLHLSDDQGWRLALRTRPELTARAAGTAVGGDAGGFYTREDWTAILDHAVARHVVIVPEIDVPGHTHAVGLAYPELVADPVITAEVRGASERFGGGLPASGTPYTGVAVGFSSLRTDDERTYEFLADVFGELASLTPGPYVHLGGDEALGTDPADYAGFVARAVDIVAATGKTPIVWHEAAAVPDLPCDVVAQYWSFVHPSTDPERAAADAAAAAAARSAASVILSPADAVYLDMKPEPGFAVGLEWAEGPTPLADAYGWEPSAVVPGLDEEDILGVEAPMWSETVRTLADIDALAFPRLAAAAELAWSSPETRDWASFLDGVAAQAGLWTALGIGFHPLAPVPWPERSS